MVVGVGVAPAYAHMLIQALVPMCPLDAGVVAVVVDGINTVGFMVRARGRRLGSLPVVVVVAVRGKNKRER